jgi:hypothetical protein
MIWFQKKKNYRLNLEYFVSSGNYDIIGKIKGEINIQISKIIQEAISAH